MVWAKTPVALGSVLCAACLAVATTTPAAERAADQLATTVERGVNLKADLSILDAFSALPTFQALLAATTPEELVAALGEYGLTDAVPFLTLLGQGNPAGLAGLDSTNAIIPLVAFALSGDTANLAGLDSVSAVPVLQALGQAQTPEDFVAALGDLDSTSAIPSYVALAGGDTTALANLESTNGIQSFEQFGATGDVSAFDQTDTQPGYAALSGLSSYRDAAAGDITALSGIDAFSGIGAYLPAPPAPAEDPAPPENTARIALAAPQDQTITDTDTGSGTGDTTGGNVGSPATTLAAKESGATDPVKTPAPTVTKSSNGSYSASFSPVGLPVLFGSGKGKGAADNGMRGYGAVANGLRAAVGLGPDTSGQGAP